MTILSTLFVFVPSSSAGKVTFTFILIVTFYWIWYSNLDNKQLVSKATIQRNLQLRQHPTISDNSKADSSSHEDTFMKRSVCAEHDGNNYHHNCYLAFENDQMLQQAVDLYLNGNNAEFLTLIDTYGEINEWDVSSIHDFSRLFENAKQVNQQLRYDVTCDLSKWNISSALNMSHMFREAEITCLYHTDWSAWDISNVIDVSGMFEGTIFDSDSDYDDIYGKLPFDKHTYNIFGSNKVSTNPMEKLFDDEFYEDDASNHDKVMSVEACSVVTDDYLGTIDTSDVGGIFADYMVKLDDDIEINNDNDIAVDALA
jgi:Mycoplasma protein of unknown function, DUF285